jgi:hypothetical protein
VPKSSAAQVGASKRRSGFVAIIRDGSVADFMTRVTARVKMVRKAVILREEDRSVEVGSTKIRMAEIDTNQLCAAKFGLAQLGSTLTFSPAFIPF